VENLLQGVVNRTGFALAAHVLFALSGAEVIQAHRPPHDLAAPCYLYSFSDAFSHSIR